MLNRWLDDLTRSNAVQSLFATGGLRIVSTPRKEARDWALSACPGPRFQLSCTGEPANYRNKGCHRLLPIRWDQTKEPLWVNRPHWVGHKCSRSAQVWGIFPTMVVGWTPRQHWRPNGQPATVKRVLRLRWPSLLNRLRRGQWWNRRYRDDERRFQLIASLSVASSSNEATFRLISCPDEYTPISIGVCVPVGARSVCRPDHGEIKDVQKLRPHRTPLLARCLRRREWKIQAVVVCRVPPVEARLPR